LNPYRSCGGLLYQLGCGLSSPVVVTRCPRSVGVWIVGEGACPGALSSLPLAGAWLAALELLAVTLPDESGSVKWVPVRTYVGCLRDLRAFSPTSVGLAPWRSPEPCSVVVLRVRSSGLPPRGLPGPSGLASGEPNEGNTTGRYRPWEGLCDPRHSSLR
jgi:hypothetical protein